MLTRLRISTTVTVAALLAACASPPPTQYSMQQPAGAPAQTITFPNGTTFGGASSKQASDLAQIVVQANNNNMQDFAQLQSSESANLQTAKQALGILERLSEQQGTGEITLFFATGESSMPQSGLQFDRLVRFLDYLSRDSRGRTVLFVMIGSTSPTGPVSVNEQLSQQRAQAPEPIIDQYLVNVPHQYYKVYGLGDFYRGKNVPPQDDQRYQSVRIIAVYQTNQVPVATQ
jgi:outer membrane protein OmpA-like peptidoglycan-associated protein